MQPNIVDPKLKAGTETWRVLSMSLAGRRAYYLSLQCLSFGEMINGGRSTLNRQQYTFIDYFLFVPVA